MKVDAISCRYQGSNIGQKAKVTYAVLAIFKPAEVTLPTTMGLKPAVVSV